MKIYIILLGFLFMTSNLIADNNDGKSSAPLKANISGKVIDKYSEEELAGVIIDVEGTDISVYTDINGNYTLKNLKPGKYTLNIKYISYKETVVEDINIDANKTEKINIQLCPL
jgi:hypothetical protein